MEIINKLRFIELIEKENLRLEIGKDGLGDNNLDIGQNIEYYFEMDGAPNVKTVFKGYQITTYQGKYPEEISFENIGELLNYLNENDYIKNDLIKIVSFGDSFPTYSKYLEKKNFDEIGMKALLEKYLPYADRFSLTCPYNDGYSLKKPYGIYNLSEEIAAKAIKKLQERTYADLKKSYENISADEKNNLPGFEELYADIEKEIKEYRIKKKKAIEKNGGFSFACDLFSKGETKYKQPQQLWHFYHNIDFICYARWICGKMSENKESADLCRELNDDLYKGLKGSLLETEVTFVWHCTISGMLSKVFYFSLNDKTVKWLSALKNDYDLKLLQDLAFYKGGTPLFSSCTHENFHNDFLADI